MAKHKHDEHHHRMMSHNKAHDAHIKGEAHSMSHLEHAVKHLGSVGAPKGKDMVEKEEHLSHKSDKPGV
jgi:hypothetical protein